MSPAAASAGVGLRLPKLAMLQDFFASVST